MMFKEYQEVFNDDNHLEMCERFYLSPNGNIVYKLTVEDYEHFPLDLHLESIDLI